MLINQSIRQQKMCYIYQYIANVYDNSLIDSIYEIIFNKPMKSAIEKLFFQGEVKFHLPLGDKGLMKLKCLNNQVCF